MSTVPNSLTQLVSMGLLTEDDLSVCGEIPDPSDASIGSLVDLLVDRQRLTQYQADKVCQGEAGKLRMGEYIIVDCLGKGGMGVVYKAIDTRMRREVAIKMLLDSGQQSEEKIQRFQREAIAAARMNHANIVTAYTAGEHDGYPYLVMEYIKGRDLGSLVKKGGKLPVSEAVNYILQAARGMEYAHSRHIVHRDIKPSNLLLATPDDSSMNTGGFSTVKILDMGLARLSDPVGDALNDGIVDSDLSVTGMLMGTIDYMAPEQAMDTKAADHRSDIYSLGCTLYFLLTKRPIYTGGNMLERISAHMKADIPLLAEKLPGEAPPELDHVFQKMVAKKPDDRYQSMSEVVKALELVDQKLRFGGNVSPGALPELRPMDSSVVPASDPGSSLGSRSGSSLLPGTDGSGLTNPSGSGPILGQPGSTYGSTIAGDPSHATASILQPTITNVQKAAIVMLVAMMGGILWYALTQVKGETELVEKITEKPVPVPVPVPVPEPPAPAFVPAFARQAEGSELSPWKDRGKTFLFHEVLEVDVSQLPPLIENAPAVAQSANPLLVRFHLITPGANGGSTRPFYIMEDKVSVDLFQQFAERNPDKLLKDTEWPMNQGKDPSLPVFHVNVMEAHWFARWMGGVLPSPEEWDTAAGFYLSPENQKTGGPFQLPKNDEDEEPNVALGKAVSMSEPTDDVSFWGVRFMAGNGIEFTRKKGSNDIRDDTTFGGSLSQGVDLRGNDFFQPILTFQVMKDRENAGITGVSNWGTGHVADAYTSFRVVLPIPTELSDDKAIEDEDVIADIENEDIPIDE